MITDDLCLFRMRCPLYYFITDYVRNVYLDEKQYEINQQIESVTKGMALVNSILKHAINLSSPIPAQTASLCYFTLSNAT